MDECFRCHSTTNKLIVNRRQPNRVIYICSPCKSIDNKKYRKVSGKPCGPVPKYNTPKEKRLARKKWNYDYRRKNPEKPLVWDKVKRANIVHKPCEVCGAMPTDRHHPDYSKPLEVVHLCRLHHRQLTSKKETATI